MVLARFTPLLCVAALAAATPAADTQFVASATTTHFTAFNPNPYTVLMILGDVAHGARAQMVVAGNASFETSFPSGTLDDLYIEVVFFAPTGRRTSGAVSFDMMLSAQADSLEVDTTFGNELQPWITTSGGRLPADSGLRLAPESMLYSPEPYTEPLLVDPNHVPVITPQDIINNSIAPKIQGTDPTV